MSTENRYLCTLVPQTPHFSLFFDGRRNLMDDHQSCSEIRVVLLRLTVVVAVVVVVLLTALQDR